MTKNMYCAFCQKFKEPHVHRLSHQKREFVEHNICPSCQFEDVNGHGSGCEKYDLWRQVQELEARVLVGEYGTKNRSQLLLKIDSIKKAI